MRFTGSFQTMTDQPREKASFSFSSTSTSGLVSVPGFAPVSEGGTTESDVGRNEPAAAARSVPGRVGIDVVTPSVNSTSNILDLPKSGVVKQFPRLGTARAVFTIKPDFARAIQFVHPFAEFRQRNQLRMRNLRDLRLERLADIQQVDLRRDLARLDRVGHVLDVDLLDMHHRLLVGRYAAELVVIDQLGHGAVRATKGTLRVL